jgi:uncharacterized membrane protein
MAEPTKKLAGAEPAHYNEVDKPRLKTQLEKIREVMLCAAQCGSWLTLEELVRLTRYPGCSISAQLRHLRKRGYVVEKRIRGERKDGLWEYRVLAGKQEAAA